MLYNQLLEELDIVEVVGEYIDLKEKGENYMSRCPFHNEDTPSFSVSPKLQIYKCFSAGCEAGGNAISFVSRMEGIHYNEAFIRLCKEYNRTDLVDKDHKKLLKLYKVNYQASKTYHYNLEDPAKYPRVIEYLKSRGINREVSRVFNLGFAPKDHYYLQRNGFEKETLKKLNLLKPSNTSLKKEFFFNRITIPFYQGGNLVGFSGRTIRDIKPKYLNTKESDFFKKKDILFGWYQNKKTIRERREALLVEGQFDVITLYAKGIKYVIAFAGSYISEKSVEFLSRNIDKLTFFADGDDPGIKAAERIISSFSSSKVSVNIIYCEGEDPSSLLNKQDWSEVKRIYSYKPLEFLYKHIGVEASMEYISEVDDPFKQGKLLKTLSSMTGKEEFQLQKMIRAPKRVSGLKVINEPKNLNPLDRVIFLSQHYDFNLSEDQKQLLLSHLHSKRVSSRQEYIQNLKADPDLSSTLYGLFEKAKNPQYLINLKGFLKTQTLKVKIKELKDKYTQTGDSSILNQIQDLNSKLLNHNG